MYYVYLLSVRGDRHRAFSRSRYIKQASTNIVLLYTLSNHSGPRVVHLRLVGMCVRRLFNSLLCFIIIIIFCFCPSSFVGYCLLRRLVCVRVCSLRVKYLLGLYLYPMYTQSPCLRVRATACVLVYAYYCCYYTLSVCSVRRRRNIEKF